MANKPWDEGSMVAAGVKQIWVEFQLYVWLLLQLEASVWSLRASFFSLKKWKSWYLSPRAVLRAKWNNVCQVPRSTPWFTVADHMEYLSPFPFSLSLGVFCDFPIKRPLCLSLFCFKVKCPKTFIWCSFLTNSSPALVTLFRRWTSCRCPVQSITQTWVTLLQLRRCVTLMNQFSLSNTSLIHKTAIKGYCEEQTK